MSQPNAQKFCQAALSHLVEVNSREGNEAIMGEINRRDFRSRKVEFWMGVTDRHSEGNWVLESTGESLPFTYWRDGEPDDGEEGNCAHWTSSMKWNDDSCNYGHHILFRDYNYNALCEI